MGSHFWLLPDPLDAVLLVALLVFLFGVAPPAVAHAKGLRWWLWAVPNQIGFVTVFLIPSPRAPGLSPAVRAARARRGDAVGAAQSLLALTAMIAGLVRRGTGW